MNPILEAALSYASMGWHVFPVAGWRKELAAERDNGKRPATKNGFKNSSSDPDQLRAWFPDGHQFNLGLDCGASGIAVVDIDCKNGKDGPANWAKWCADNNVPSNGTARQFTPSGGWHLFYRGACKSVNDKIATGVDTKSTGGYVLLAPSTISGKPYSWDPDSNPEMVDLMPQVAAAVSAPLPAASAPLPQHILARPAASAVAGGSLMEMAASDLATISRRSGQLEGPCPFCLQGTDCFHVSLSSSPGRDGSHEYYHCRKCGTQGDAAEWDIKIRKVGVVQAKLSRGIKVDSQYIPIAARLGSQDAPRLHNSPTPSLAPAPEQTTSATPASNAIPAPDAPSPLTIESTQCHWIDGYQKKSIPFVFEDFLPRGIVGSINAEGGTGKTFLLISMFVAAATGLPWGPFRPVEPQKVLLLLAEDPEDILKNRIFDIVSAMVPKTHMDLFKINFHFAALRGKAGPLLCLENGNPCPTKWAQWVDDHISLHGGTLAMVGVDPLRKFLGLEENKNEFAHAFISLLESISEHYLLTIIFVHHIAKAVRSSEVSQISGRGAGGFGDDGRWSVNMKELDPKKFTLLDLPGSPSEYVEMLAVKNSYATKSISSTIFRRGEHGVITPVDITNVMLVQSEYLAELIAGKSLSKRDIIDRLAGQEIRKAMKDRFAGFGAKQIESLIGYSLSVGIMAEETIPARGGQTKTVLTAKEGYGF